jgi:hypothetical protein
MLIEVCELSSSSVTIAKSMETSYVTCSNNGWLGFICSHGHIWTISVSQDNNLLVQIIGMILR